MNTVEKWALAADMGADAVVEYLRTRDEKILREAKVGLAAGMVYVKKLSADNNREALRLMAAGRGKAQNLIGD